MIKTTTEYRAFLDATKEDLIAIWDNLPSKKRNEMAIKIAASLSISQTTVINYFKGLISSPQTALTIIEKYKELFP